MKGIFSILTVLSMVFGLTVSAHAYPYAYPYTYALAQTVWNFVEDKSTDYAEASVESYTYEYPKILFSSAAASANVATGALQAIAQNKPVGYYAYNYYAFAEAFAYDRFTFFGPPHRHAF